MHARAGRPPRPRRGVTTVEVLAAALALAVLMWLASGIYDEMLDRARTRQAHRLIRTLATALDAYFQDTDAHPPGDDDGAIPSALQALLSRPDSAKVLGEVDLKLLHVRQGRAVCRDPWGRRLRYLSTDIHHPALRRRVEQNDGRPIFESSGPDGRFGDSADTAAADDICSDDPGM
ncbi:MAG: hypothetical protein GY778_15320 [bacterium]|nr:hypothetical protein [bacterium]